MKSGNEITDTCISIYMYICSSWKCFRYLYDFRKFSIWIEMCNLLQKLCFYQRWLSREMWHAQGQRRDPESQWSGYYGDAALWGLDSPEVFGWGTSPFNDSSESPTEHWITADWPHNEQSTSVIQINQQLFLLMIDVYQWARF